MYSLTTQQRSSTVSVCCMYARAASFLRSTSRDGSQPVVTWRECTAVSLSACLSNGIGAAGMKKIVLWSIYFLHRFLPFFLPTRATTTTSFAILPARDAFLFLPVALGRSIGITAVAVSQACIIDNCTVLANISRFCSFIALCSCWNSSVPPPSACKGCSLVCRKNNDSKMSRGMRTEAIVHWACGTSKHPGHPLQLFGMEAPGVKVLIE